MKDPTPDQPGIRISAPPAYRDHDDPARWSTRTAEAPMASYACSCGQTGHATGTSKVQALVSEYGEHTATCEGR
ncbi:hypothetical protein [Streptomyces cinnamoneus]|uniref:Mobile element transfer n=1 Tax=Streptomyces cinnamoneus TaxID=53446 RepID=A0A918WJK7_STRCJ|nr:hypothetical protein [Streptomyces cinnamoneus]GHC52325.1 hypothetical protein GCM10010507_30550 [Streptomyces cinnamoneus]